MLITLTQKADVAAVEQALRGLGLWTERMAGAAGPPAIYVSQSSAAVDPGHISAIAGVAEVLCRASSHPRVDAQRGQSITVGPASVGAATAPVLMAGPCSVESPEQIHRAADMAARAGAQLLRGGAFKPRTSPYAFRGHGRRALGWMRAAADAHGLGVVTEVMSEREVDAVGEVSDLVQIGSRNMQNFALLDAAGRAGLPILLKRGMAARVDDWLLAGEHALAAGAPRVIFCERGIVGFDPHTRNLLDLGAVALLRHAFGQPVVVDPSHAAGRRELIVPLARAALAAGACGLLVEAHPAPGEALSDGPQALDGRTLAEIGALVRMAPAERLAS